MKTTRLAISNVVLFEPRIFGNDRGFFFESFNQKVLGEAIGRLLTSVQDNYSYSRSVKGVLRGPCYQLQNPQGKLARVVRGKVFDVMAEDFA